MEESRPKLNLLEYTTIIYAFFTLLGYSYIDSYFDHWGIKIYSFLDASEILVLFLNNITYMLLLILAFYYSIFWLLPKGKIKEIPIIKKESNAKNPVNIKLYIWISIFVLTLVYLYVAYKWNKPILINSYVFVALIGMIYLTYHRFPIWFENGNIAFNKKYIRIVLLMAVLFIFNVFCADIKYFKMSKSHSTKFYFNYESAIYSSNDSLQYIGATAKYIFLRNTKCETNLIFEKSNIKNLSLVEKSNKPK